MPDSLSSASLIANPTLSADPRRYSSHDSPANINRFVQQLRFMLPWRRINGQFLDVRGHDPSDAGVTATFYNHQATGVPPPIPSTAYIFADPSVDPSITFSLKEITALFELRMFSQQLLSREFNQIRFQKQALRHAVCARLESTLINGNESTNPAEFDGLRRLVDRGAGQRLIASAGDELSAINRAMTLIRFFEFPRAG